MRKPRAVTAGPTAGDDAVLTDTHAERLDARLSRLETDLAALRAIIVAHDERAQEDLKAGLASAVNLLSVLPRLGLEGVLPQFPHHGYAVTGEMAAYLAHLVARRRPALLVELGSGSSTFLLAAALRANGAGRLVSIEHDPDHKQRTAALIAQAELSDWVDLVEAPLVEQTFGERRMQWYDLARVRPRLGAPIDLLFVDGPPARIQPLSRYPALPALSPWLAVGALVLLDDGARADETRIVELWRDVDRLPIAVERLDFLPRAPLSITVLAPDELGLPEDAPQPK